MLIVFAIVFSKPMMSTLTTTLEMFRFKDAGMYTVYIFLMMFCIKCTQRMPGAFWS